MFLTVFLNRFGILELQNRVTQNEVTLRFINSKTFTEILFSSYLKLKNKSFHFELLHQN